MIENDASPGRQVAWAYTMMVRHQPRWAWRRPTLPRRWCDVCDAPAPCAYYRNAALIGDRYGPSMLERWYERVVDRGDLHTVMLPTLPPGGDREPGELWVIAGLVVLCPVLMALVVYRLMV